MKEKNTARLINRAISDRHIEEAANAEEIFAERKREISLRRRRYLKTVSVFAACFAIVLALSLTAMHIADRPNADIGGAPPSFGDTGDETDNNLNNGFTSSEPDSTTEPGDSTAEEPTPPVGDVDEELPPIFDPAPEYNIYSEKLPTYGAAPTPSVGTYALGDSSAKESIEEAYNFKNMFTTVAFSAENFKILEDAAIDFVREFCEENGITDTCRIRVSKKGLFTDEIMISVGYATFEGDEHGPIGFIIVEKPKV